MKFLDTLFNLENKVAILTGGGGILAGEMAKGFLNAGVKIVLLDINDENLKKKTEALKQINKNVIGFKCSVLDEASIQKAQAAILNEFGRIDILVNAAGGNIAGATIGIDQTIFDLQIDQFKKVTDLNLNGTVLPTLIFGKTMAEQKSGSIINISSMAASRAISRIVGYSSAKAAIENFTRWMAVELSSKFGGGIRVNAIAPGWLITEQNRALLTNEDGSLTERGKTVINLTPFKRFGDPSELIGAVLFLASDAAKFVTGVIIPIDGGFSSFSGV
ncbi:MAG: SDR family oxidoreductase [Ignavibacteriaceae bacterium]|jgi:NAD(P)-dependent dehydrogenase (short-subunit alcohol dehydrogenase family)